MEKVSVHVTLQYDPADLWSMVMGAGWETWPWWVQTHYQEGDWQTPGVLRVTAWNGEDEGEGDYVTRDITISDVVKALSDLKDHSVVMDNLAKEDLDASSSDCVIQQVVYGEVVYG